MPVKSMEIFRFFGKICFFWLFFCFFFFFAFLANFDFFGNLFDFLEIFSFFWQFFIFYCRYSANTAIRSKRSRKQFVLRSRNLSSNRFFPLLFAAAEIFVQIHFRKYYLTGLNIVSVLTLLGKTENLKSV
jgi:hypothetical protein